MCKIYRAVFRKYFKVFCLLTILCGICLIWSYPWKDHSVEKGESGRNVTDYLSATKEWRERNHIKFLDGMFRSASRGKVKLPNELPQMITNEAKLKYETKQNENEENTNENERQVQYESRPNREVKIKKAGENIQIGEREIYILSAIHRRHYPSPDNITVMLVGWADEDSYHNHTFSCCLATSKHFDHVVQVKATPVHFDRRYKVIMHFVQYACPTGNFSAGFQYVAFTESSCDEAMTECREIVVPKQGRNKMAVCSKVAFGDLDPERLVEWMEFYRLVGVSAVQLYTHSLSERAMRVFQYYQKTGFLILAPINLPSKKGYPERDFFNQSREVSAWMDGLVMLNECFHRHSRFDFIAVLDLDELLFPTDVKTTLPQMVQAAFKEYPRAAVFSCYAYQTILDWPASNTKSPLFFLQHLDRTASDHLDHKGLGRSSPKIIFRPDRAHTVTTHVLHRVPGFTKETLPQSSYTFLHYRRCKEALWHGCNMTRVTDTQLLRFEHQWLRALSRLPLKQLGFSEDHVAQILEGNRKRQRK